MRLVKKDLTLTTRTGNKALAADTKKMKDYVISSFCYKERRNDVIKKMKKQLNSNKKQYIDLKSNIKYLIDMLEGAEQNEATLSSFYWLNGFESCQLIADAYKVKFVIISNDCSTNMIVPLCGASTKEKPIVLLHENFLKQMLIRCCTRCVTS